MIHTNQYPNCSCAKAVEFGDETFYECAAPTSRYYESLCNVDICCPNDGRS